MPSYIAWAALVDKLSRDAGPGLSDGVPDLCAFGRYLEHGQI